MPAYIITAVVVVVLTSMVFAYVLNKNKLLNARIFLAIILSSITASLLFPLIFGLVASIGSIFTDGMGLFLAFMVTIAVYMILILIFSIIVSSMISDEKLKGLVDSLKSSFSRILQKSVDSGQNTDKMGLGIDIKDVDNTQNMEELHNSIDEQEADKLDQFAEVPDSGGINADVSDSQEAGMVNERKGRLDPDVEYSINEYVDEAFRLKESGDYEGAILYYMYALDKNPDKNLVFWIVLDICVLYKSLGQSELARDILESYSNNYGDIMDYDVKEEIESNLINF